MVAERKGHATRRPGRASRQNGLTHHQNHDADHQHRRYFVDDPIESLRMPVAIGGEIRAQRASNPCMAEIDQDQHELGLQASATCNQSAVLGEPEAQHPGGDHGRIDDRRAAAGAP